MKRQNLKNIDEIFSETWRLYKSRALPIWAVTLLSILVTVFLIAACGAAAFFGLGLEQAFAGDVRSILLNPAVLGAGAALLLTATLLMTWCQAAVLTVTVDQELGIMGGFRAGCKYVLPMLWIGSLYLGIVMTGFIFFIVPGLIFGLSMSLCFYIMVEEDLPGIDAVLASRLYMRGHWWNTFFKFSLVWLISFLIGLLYYVGHIYIFLFLSFLFAPFLMLFMVVVYRDLKEVAGEVDPSSCRRWLWVLMGGVGFLLPLLAVIAGLVTVGPQIPEEMKRLKREVNSTLGTEVFSQPTATPSTRLPGDNSGITVPVVRQLPSVDGFLIWRDPAGDTHNPLLDIKEVSAKGEQGELLLRVTLTSSFSAYFATAGAESFTPLISFYIDTDVDRATGGAPFNEGRGRTGYDMHIEVLLVARQSNADKISGQTTQTTDVSLYQLDGRTRRSLSSLEDSTVSISEDILNIRLPYSQLKVSGGDTVRVCYREAAQRQGIGLAKDKLVPLK
jgi:hypothetical protein